MLDVTLAIVYVICSTSHWADVALDIVHVIIMADVALDISTCNMLDVAVDIVHVTCWTSG